MARRIIILLPLLLLGTVLRAQEHSAASDTTQSHRDSTAVRDSVDQDTLYQYPANAVGDSLNYSGDDSEEDYSIDSANTVSLLHARCSFGLTFDIAAISAQDIVAYINQNSGGNSITPHTFATAAAFSSAFTYNASQDMDAALEYSFVTDAYQFGDLNSGGYNFSYDLHRFTAVIHRLFNHDYYGVAAGAGVGYTLGVFRQTTPAASGGQQYQAGGGNIVGEIILRSVFGGHFYMRIELQGFYTFTNALNDHGTILHNGAPPSQTNITLGAFGGNVGLGLEYFF